MARATDISAENAEVASHVLRDFMRDWLAEYNRIWDAYDADVAKFNGTESHEP